MKYLLVILLVFSIAFSSLKSEDDDAVYNFIKYEYVLDNDGSWTLEYSHQMELFSYYAINRSHGESFVIYNPKYQELKITKNQTKMRNGSIITAPFNTNNEVLPRFAAGFPDVMHLREMVVTHTGLESECVVDYSYTLKSKADFLPGMMDKIIIGKNSSVKKFEIVIKVPTKTEFSLNIANDYAPLNKKTANGFDTYTWIFENLAPIGPEYNQPSPEDFVPILYFSTALTNEAVVNHIMSNKDLFKVNGQIESKVSEITNDKFKVFEKAIALRDYINNNIVIMHEGLIHLGFNPKKAVKTFKDGYGTQLDAAILLSAMAKYVGVNATPIILSYGSSCSDDISVLTQYHYPVVLFKDEDAFTPYMILDPLNTNTRQLANKYLGRPYIPLDKNFNKMMRLISKRRTALLNYFSSLKIDTSLNFEGSAQIMVRGDYLSDYNTSALENSIQSKIKKFHFVSEVVENKSISERPGTFSQSYKVSGIINSADNKFVTLEIPSSPMNFESKHLVFADFDRKTPVKLPYYPLEEETHSIVIPNNMTLITKELNLKTINDLGEINLTVQKFGDKIVIKRTLKILKDVVPKENYKNLLELMKVYNTKFRKLTFEITK